MSPHLTETTEKISDRKLLLSNLNRKCAVLQIANEFLCEGELVGIVDRHELDSGAAGVPRRKYILSLRLLKTRFRISIHECAKELTPWGTMP